MFEQEKEAILELVAQKEEGYRPEYADLAFRMAAYMGMKEEEIARALSISQAVFDKWKCERWDFYNAIVNGLDYFNRKTVEGCLMKRITGYETEEVTTEETTITMNKDGGKVKLPAQKVVRTRKTVGPDVGAIQFWLMNRSPDRWKSVKHIEKQITVEKGLDLTKLEESELEELKKLIERTRPEPTTSTGGTGKSLLEPIRSRVLGSHRDP